MTVEIREQAKAADTYFETLDIDKILCGAEKISTPNFDHDGLGSKNATGIYTNLPSNIQAVICTCTSYSHISLALRSCIYIRSGSCGGRTKAY